MRGKTSTWKAPQRLVPAGLAAALTMTLTLWSGGASVAGAEEVFQGFTRHIGGQITLDKREFVEAEACTIWFYKQQYQKAPRPPVEKAAYSPGGRRRAGPEAECADRYPSLEAARDGFSRTQSALSVSLTFYEFALVGDRNDDGQYNSAEIKDMLESFGLSFQAELASRFYLELLNEKFDGIYKTASLELLMAGLGILYDRGYRFSPQDRADLDKISQ